eukprot:jgi/Tetstr1/420309/TSEL_011430.t1
MPKGKKRKNPGVGIDFKRARSKVGKTLPKAANATDTTIRSRSINLPGQNIRDGTTTASGPAVTQRNLNLKELLAQTAHYSEKVRREALAGLSELLAAHPREARKAPHDVLEKLSARMTDSDSAVRKALPVLFRNVVLPALEGCDASAHLPMVMAHLCSAMTHITDAVRIDALAMLDVLMGWAPGEIVDGHLAPCLSVYAHMLSPTQRSRSVQTQSVASLCKTASSLRGFLQTAAAAAAPTAAAAAPKRGAAATGRVLHSYARAWPPRSSMQPARAGRQGAGAGEQVRALVDLVQKVLEGWMECAPSQLALQPDTAAAVAMKELLGCANLLLDRLRVASADGGLGAQVELALGKKGKRQRVVLRAAILKLVVPHFPVQPSSDTVAAADLTDALAWINIHAAEMLQRLLAGSEGEEWPSRVVHFWAGVCGTGAVLTAWGDGASIEVSPEVLESAVQSALQGCESSLPLVPPSHRSVLVTAVQALSTRSPPKSALRSTCLRLQQQLLARAVASPGGLVPAAEAAAAARSGAAATAASPQLLTEEEVAGWLQPLPRMLWELGSGAPSTSEAALRLLLCVGCVARPGSPLLACLDALQAQLVPFFLLSLPGKAAKGKRKSGSETDGKKELFAAPGPLVELPLPAQRLAMDLLWYLPSLSEATLRAVLMMALVRQGRPSKRGGGGGGAYPLSLVLRAVEVITERYGSGGPQSGTDIAAHLSFLLSLLAGDASQLRPSERWPSVAAGEGGAAGAPARRYWEAHAALAAAAARAATAPGMRGVLLPPLLPALRRLLDASPPPGAKGQPHPHVRLWYGALALADAALPGGDNQRGEAPPIPQQSTPFANVTRTAVLYPLQHGCRHGGCT